MNLYQLRYFLELAEKRQYTKAARQLNITQPSLSYAISQLENELGVKLFEKDGRTISLTDCGRDLAGCASESLAILDKGIANLKRKAAGGEDPSWISTDTGNRLYPGSCLPLSEAEPGQGNNVPFPYRLYRCFA